MLIKKEVKEEEENVTNIYFQDFCWILFYF